MAMIDHNQRYVVVVLVLLGTFFYPVTSQISVIDKRSLVNTCIDGNNHKREPGPEDDLHKQCTPWKKNSCCTGNTTIHAHGKQAHGFNYNHCPNQTMSDKCAKHFIQDLCFYECSPNVGPWIQTVKMKIRRERYYDVPLCASDCDNWFDACRDDYTCTDNWTLNFDWENGINQCPSGSKCRTFSEVFQNASNFCERVWDHSWKYTEDDRPCMRIWFDGDQGNPNEAVARWKINQTSSSKHSIPGLIAYVLPVLLFLWYC